MATKKKTEKEQAQMEQGQRETRGKAVQRIRPAGGFPSPFEEMDRLFESFFPRGWMHPLRMEWPMWPELMRMPRMSMPKVDVVDRDAEVLVRAELPGVKKEDLDISVLDDTVTIRGSSRSEEEEEKGQYYRRERQYGEFARTIGLPAAVDANKCKASFKEGILELTLPKLGGTTRRTIRIEEE